MEPKDVRITIAPQAVWMVVASLLGLWLAYLLRDVVVLFIIVLAVTVAFSPIVRSWEKFVPRVAAIVIVYLIFLAVVAALVALFVPPVLAQMSDFIGFIQHRYFDTLGADNSFLTRLQNNLNDLVTERDFQSLGSIVSQFQGSFGAVFTTTLGVIGGLVGLLTVFVSSFYLLLEEKHLGQFLSGFLTPEKRDRTIAVIEKMSQKIGDWLRGQVLLMVIVGAAIGIGLAIFGVPYALVLGLWAGVTEALPVVGPFLGAIPAIAVAFATLGWIKGLLVVALFIVVQQIENHILVPKIMGRALGLSPVMIIFSLLVWGKLLGFLGVIIAIPITAALSVVLQEWRKAKA